MKHGVSEESGASLIMVVIFITVFSVVTAAILNFESTGFKTTQAIATIRDQQHAAEAAVDGAINAIRGSSTAGYVNSPFPCPQFTYTPPTSADPTVIVSCTPKGGSIGSGTDTIPKYAVLTLGPGDADGFTQSGNETLYIDGGIFSNGHINTGTQPKDHISVLGDAFAVKSCTPTVSGGGPDLTKLTATGQTSCNLGSSSAESDPAYPAAVSNLSGMPVPTTATCTSSNSVVKFTPGLYTESLDSYVPSSCKGNVWWFAPHQSGGVSDGLGVYYFDPPASGSLWDLQALKINVVGGESGSWNASSSSSSVTFPGACDPSRHGVQFIFGGGMQLNVQQVSGAGNLQLCTEASTTTQQQIALYGVPSGTRTTVTGGTFVNKTDPTGGFTPGSAAKSQDNVPATAGLSGDGPKTATETYSDFGDIDLGSDVTNVYLDVYHAEIGANASSVDPSVSLTVNGTTTSHALTNHTSYASADTWNVTGLLKTKFRYADVNSLSAAFTANGSSLQGAHTGEPCTGHGSHQVCTPYPADTATAQLDAVVLRVDYKKPGLERECASSGCTILVAGNNSKAIFKGTFYAPTAYINAAVHNGGDIVFARGVIAWKIDVDSSASLKQDDAPFQLPGLTGVRVVLFEATISGTPKLRALVAYTDTANGAELPGAGVTVQKWLVLR